MYQEVKRKIRFGILGTGSTAIAVTSCLERLSSAEMIGVYGKDITQLSAFCQRFKIKAFRTLKNLLEADIDAVLVCSANGLHAPYAITAADFGKHIFIEKPMAINIEQLKDLATSCEHNRVRLVQSSPILFSEDVQKAKHVINTGSLGKIIMASFIYKNKIDETFYYDGGWRGTKALAGGGPWMNQSLEGIALLLYLLGPVKAVNAMIKTRKHDFEIEDTAVATLDFVGGGLAYLAASIAIEGDIENSLTIHGSKGTIILADGLLVKLNYLNKENKLIEKDKKVTPLRGYENDVKQPGLAGAFYQELYRTQLEDFVLALQQGTEPMFNKYNAEEVMETIFALYASAKQGGTVVLGE